MLLIGQVEEENLVGLVFGSEEGGGHFENVFHAFEFVSFEYEFEPHNKI